MKNVIEKFVVRLGLDPDEVLRALISAFCPTSPGAIRQSWKHRKNYGEPPTTREIWNLWRDYIFRKPTKFPVFPQ